MWRSIMALAVSAAVTVSATATSTSNANQAALASGDAAGVKKAEAFGGHQLLWLLGGGIVVGGIVLVATGNGHGAVQCALPGCTPPPSPPPTTTTTSTAQH